MVESTVKVMGLPLLKDCLKLYIKSAWECLTVISKHESAYEARGAKARELYIAFECFDIMGKHERKFLI